NDMQKSIFAGRFGIRTLFVGIVIALLSIGVALVYIYHGSDKWQTVLFTLIALLQITQSFSARTLKGSVLKKNLFGNRLLCMMMGSVLLLQLAVIYIKPAADLFSIRALSMNDWGIMIATCIIFFIIIEIEKSMGKNN
ncbi:MAG: cation-translocating P-type ATPase C-terminal domain-containing protein, partial [Fusobacteria bacterium]|nr:cation-translocating P-type ATPase C-terminal domain-containing protein [Fusobacteriota bacterium]